MVRVEHVLDSWKAIRGATAEAVTDMPNRDMSFKPLPDVDSFGEIARHILHAGHALTGMLLAGVDDMTVNFRAQLPNYSYPLGDDAAPEALAKALEAGVEQRISELSAQTAEWWGGMILRFDGQTVTRLETLQFIKEHELAHRSQLFMYLRMKGVVPGTTRRRLAKKRAQEGR